MNNNRFTRLKICGIRSIEEIEELKDLPVNYFGCIFVSKSPRFVSNELAKKITEIAHSAEKKTVGVFLDEKIENIVDIIKKTDIDTVQLHGKYFHRNPPEVFGLPVHFDSLLFIGPIDFQSRQALQIFQKAVAEFCIARPIFS